MFSCWSVLFHENNIWIELKSWDLLGLCLLNGLNFILNSNSSNTDCFRDDAITIISKTLKIKMNKLNKRQNIEKVGFKVTTETFKLEWDILDINLNFTHIIYKPCSKLNKTANVG